METTPKLTGICMAASSSHADLARKLVPPLTTAQVCWLMKTTPQEMVVAIQSLGVQI